MGHTVIEHFVGRLPQVREIYDTLIAATNEFGPVVEDPKKRRSILTADRHLPGFKCEVDI